MPFTLLHNSLIGFRSGLYGGRNRTSAPAYRIACRTLECRFGLRLSSTTMSPGPDEERGVIERPRKAFMWRTSGPVAALRPRSPSARFPGLRRQPARPAASTHESAEDWWSRPFPREIPGDRRRSDGPLVSSSSAASQRPDDPTRRRGATFFAGSPAGAARCGLASEIPPGRNVRRVPTASRRDQRSPGGGGARVGPPRGRAASQMV